MVEIGYTNSEILRSVLGITEEDLDDAQLLARGLDKELNIDLMSWLPTAGDLIYIGTPEQIDSIGLYANYFCAYLASQSLRMAATQKITDGANALDRFANVDWDAMQAQLKERSTFYKKFLLDSIGTIASTGVKRFSIVGSGYDPVTGV